MEDFAQIIGEGVGSLKQSSGHALVVPKDLPVIPSKPAEIGYSVQRPLLGMFGGVSLLAEVRVQEGEPLENALRRFKRKVQTEDIIKEVKRHSFYLKPGEKKRVKEALARKRNRKKVRKEQD
jgi:small subunit ribosomal protein S21